MIYSFLKTVCKLALKVYFRKTYVNGKDKIPQKGPYLIVANHPSSFLDPLCIASQIEPKINFLAKGVMFKNKLIASILRGLNMVPIHRAQDNPKMLNQNKAVFKDCFKKLGKNEVIMIFPEGTSEMERRLRKIKTGASRIALGAEKENDFQLNLKILPVGLNYTKSSRFRSEVIINFGDAIEVSDYFQQYNENEIEATKSLTDRIETEIRDLMIAIDKEEHDELVENIESLYKSNLSEDNTLENIKISQTIVEAIDYYQKTNPIVYDTMANKIDQYYMKLKRLSLSDRSLKKIKERKRFLPEMIKSTLALILGFPLWLFGFITSYIPYKLPRAIALKITDSEAFYGALLMSLGTLLFILFYSAQIIVSWLLFHNWIITLSFGILLILSAFFTIYYARNARRLYFNFSLALKLTRKKELIKELIIERKKIINELSDIGQNYLSSIQS